MLCQIVELDSLPSARLQLHMCMCMCVCINILHMCVCSTDSDKLHTQEAGVTWLCHRRSMGTWIKPQLTPGLLPRSVFYWLV